MQTIGGEEAHRKATLTDIETFLHVYLEISNYYHSNTGCLKRCVPFFLQ